MKNGKHSSGGIESKRGGRPQGLRFERNEINLEMKDIIKQYASTKGAKPALNQYGNLMVDHEDKFIDISWQEFFRKLNKSRKNIVVARDAVETLA